MKKYNEIQLTKKQNGLEKSKKIIHPSPYLVIMRNKNTVCAASLQQAAARVFEGEDNIALALAGKTCRKNK